ncbi:UNVERIFIED_CONTAM: hypothetical protein NCL1_16869 [Trichonephila clavipes]
MKGMNKFQEFCGKLVRVVSLSVSSRNNVSSSAFHYVYYPRRSLNSLDFKLKDTFCVSSSSLSTNKELGNPGIKREKAHVKLDERIENIPKEFETSNNLEKNV